MQHYLAPDIRDAQITDLVSDGADSVYFHLDNGLLIAVNAVLIMGMPVLHIARVDPAHPPVERATN